MDFLIIGIIGIFVLIVLLLLGVHIGIGLIVVGSLGLSLIIGFEGAISSAGETVYHKVISFELITIPLFIFMGYLASAGGISNKIFTTLQQWVGGARGGVGVTTVCSATAFGAVCGSSLVVSSVFAKLAAPEMRKFGYNKRIAYGICASAGMIGMITPPSILMVVYGVQANMSVGKLLIAGIVPGLMLTLFFCISVVIIARYFPKLIDEKQPEQQSLTVWEKFKSLASLWQIWVVAIVIFGGIFGGIFNPSEAASVATVTLMLLLAFANFTKPRELFEMYRYAFTETAGTTCMIFLVMGGASVFSQFLVLTGVTSAIANWAINLDISPILLVAIIVLIYVVIGTLLDSISMVCITVPLFNPVINSLGVDPLWYALVVVMAIEVGLLTPPVGLNVYGAYAVAEKDVSLEDIFIGVLPFFFAIWLTILLFFVFPPITTFLPNMMM